MSRQVSGWLSQQTAAEETGETSSVCEWVGSNNKQKDSLLSL
jgi:hypothetical protein